MDKQTIRLSVVIDASPQKVWDVLLQDETYRQWTAVFHPGSYAESDWKTGSRAYFKTPEGDGMISRIVQHEPAQVIVLEHFGVLKDGREDYESEEVKKWQGFKEIYRLSNVNGKTKLTIEQEITPEYYEMFSATWEKALAKVKELSENT